MYKNKKGDIYSLLKKEDRRVVIFGCGEDGKRLANTLIKSNIPIAGAYCNDESKWGGWLSAGNTEVCPILSGKEFIAECKKKENIIIIASSKYANEMANQLVDLGVLHFLNYEEIDFPVVE